MISNTMNFPNRFLKDTLAFSGCVYYMYIVLLKALKMLNNCSNEYIPGNNILAYKMSECGENKAREGSSIFCPHFHFCVCVCVSLTVMIFLFKRALYSLASLAVKLFILETGDRS